MSTMVERKKPKVCRNLFGKPTEQDRTNMNLELNAIYKEDTDKARELYAFDIVNDQPLSDKWEIAEECPAFYTKGYESKFRQSTRPDVTKRRRLDFSCGDVSDSEDGQVSCENCDDSGISSPSSVCNTSTDLSASVGKLVQKNLTSYMKVKKRKRLVTSAASKCPRLR